MLLGISGVLVYGAVSTIEATESTFDGLWLATTDEELAAAIRTILPSCTGETERIWPRLKAADLQLRRDLDATSSIAAAKESVRSYLAEVKAVARVQLLWAGSLFAAGLAVILVAALRLRHATAHAGDTILAAAIHGSDVGVLVCDTERVRSANPAWTRHTGLESRLLINQETELVQSLLDADLRQSASVSLSESCNIIVGEDRRELTWRTSPIKTADGTLVGRLILLWPRDDTGSYSAAVKEVSEELGEWMTDPVNAMILDIETVARYVQALSGLKDTAPMMVRELDRFEQTDVDESIIDDLAYEHCRDLMEQLCEDNDGEVDQDAEALLKELRLTLHGLSERITGMQAVSAKDR